MLLWSVACHRRAAGGPAEGCKVNPTTGPQALRCVRARCLPDWVGALLTSHTTTHTYKHNDVPSSHPHDSHITNHIYLTKQISLPERVGALVKNNVIMRNASQLVACTGDVHGSAKDSVPPYLAAPCRLLTHLSTHSLTHLLANSLTHSLPYSLTHSHTHSFTHSLIHALTHSLTHTLTTTTTTTTTTITSQLTTYLSN